MPLPKSLIAAASLALLVTTPAWAQAEPAPGASASASLTLTLESNGDMERRLALYLCSGETETLRVQYINAAPNFLAVVPVDGQNLVFAAALSASGARYVSGPFEWWSKGGEATLRDLMQDEDAAPLAECTESSNTP